MSFNPQTPQFFYAYMDSPIGRLTIIASAQGLTEIRFPNQHSTQSASSPYARNSNKDSPHYIEQALDQLRAYFAGKLTVFDLTLAPRGTDFQQTVWTQLRTVPFGATASYGAIAAAIGKPNAARAVGMANSKNPLPIVVPCHRIIGSNGALTGFAGGLDTKRWLLAHELSTG